MGHRHPHGHRMTKREREAAYAANAPLGALPSDSGVSISDSEANALVDEAIDLRNRLSWPTDAEVIRCMIDNGCPPKDAERQVTASRKATSQYLGMFARKFYVDVQDAAKGDPEAKARVEHVREAWGRQKARQAAAGASQATA